MPRKARAPRWGAVWNLEALEKHRRGGFWQARALIRVLDAAYPEWLTTRECRALVAIALGLGSRDSRWLQFSNLTRALSRLHGRRVLDKVPGHDRLAGKLPGGQWVKGDPPLYRARREPKDLM